MERVENLLGAKDKIVQSLGIRVRKFNRTSYSINGKFVIKMNLDNSFIVGFKAYNLAGGQYKMILERDMGSFCSVAGQEHLKKTYRVFLKHSNASWIWNECPIRNQTVNIKDWLPTEVGDFIPPYVPLGERWKVETYVKRNEIILGGFTTYAILRSEYSLLRYGGK